MYTDCPYVIWSHKCNLATTLSLPCMLVETNRWVLRSQGGEWWQKVILPHFSLFLFFLSLFICCCCHALCQSTLLKATATITPGQGGWEGDNVFGLWLHLVLGESVAIDGRQAVLLSVLFSIYGCLRAQSPVHACLSQNMKVLLGLSLWCCGRHRGVQM